MPPTGNTPAAKHRRIRCREQSGQSYRRLRRDLGPSLPDALLKLYLYGYLNRVHSSRRLECETVRNLEVIWLLEDLRPGYKTIANFRKDNSAVLKAVNQDFILLCKQLGLFGGEQAAVDGSFFKGDASCDGIY